MSARNTHIVGQLGLILLICCQAFVDARGDDVRVADDTTSVRRIITEADVRGGLVVHVGCGDGRLIAGLGETKLFRVHGLDTDAGHIEQSRNRIASLGLETDVFVMAFDGHRLPYADNMVNLLIADAKRSVDAGELTRVLVPGGTLCTKRDGQWTRTVKPWPKEMDEWTHWLHGPDANAVAHDTIAGPPRRLQWIAKPYWLRHHNTVPSVSDFVSARGRVFYIVDEAPAGMDGSVPDKWSLVARDAFNGLPLWRKAMPQWGWKTWSADWKCRFTIPTHITRRLVAAGDRVYVTLGFNAPLTELDAATGDVLRTFDGTQFTDEILCDNGLLILALNQAPQRPGASQRSDQNDPPVMKQVAAIDVDSGKMQWKTGDYVGLRSKTGSMERISHLSMCTGDGRVFFVDRDRLICLSLTTGQQLWQAARPQSPEFRARYNIRISDMCSLVYQNGVLFFAQTNPAEKRLGWRGERGRLHAFSAATGKELWDRECCSWGWGHPADVFVVGGLVWAHDFQTPFIMGMDPMTGEVQRKVSNFKAFDNGHHHRCYRNKATTRFMMTSYRGLEFIDWDGQTTSRNHWVRGTCRLGAFPCNGLIYATPHPCSCYVSSKLNGFVALAPESQSPASTPETHPLHPGPAFGQTLEPESSTADSSDWLMFRHDCRRSGSTKTPLPPNLAKAWQVDLGSKPTSCVAAGDRVLVAIPDRHQVVELSAENGNRIWEFTAGGSIDTPPTIDGNRVCFGCSDGWLYCVRLSDGQLIWKLRGAPRERLVGAFGDIESAWPIHGSPLVKDEVVYFTAGRSSFLDGGILAFAVDVRTGEIVESHTIVSDHDMEVDTGSNPLSDTGLLTDPLVARGHSVYMRQRQIFSASSATGDGAATPAETDVLLRTTSGMLDDEWFSRVRWYLDNRPVAEYLVFDDESVYGIREREAISANGGFFAPGKRGYELFAADLRSIKGSNQSKAARFSKKKTGGAFPKRWSLHVPVRVTAMVLAGDTVFAAGTPDVVDSTDPWAAYEGRRGGQLLAIRAANGTILTKMKLDAPPVLDGMAVAHGRLYVSTVGGKLLCCKPSIK